MGGFPSTLQQQQANLKCLPPFQGHLFSASISHQLKSPATAPTFHLWHESSRQPTQKLHIWNYQWRAVCQILFLVTEKENKTEVGSIWKIPNFYLIPDQDSLSKQTKCPRILMQPLRARIHPLGAYRYQGATCDLLLLTKSNRKEPSERRWDNQVNKWQQAAAPPAPAAGRGPGQPRAGERRLPPSSGSCARHPGREVRRGRDRGERQIKRKKTKREHAKQIRDSWRGNRKILSLKVPKMTFLMSA